MFDKEQTGYNKVFIDHLIQSQAASYFIGCWFRSWGYDIRWFPTDVRPTRDNWEKYVDAGDLLVKIDGVEKRIEVKEQKQQPWSSRDEFAAKHSSLIVNSVSNDDRKEGSVGKLDEYGRIVVHPLFCYVIISTTWQCAGIVQPETREHWFKETKFNPLYDENHEFYFCPNKYVIWRDIGFRDK